MGADTIVSPDMLRRPNVPACKTLVFYVDGFRRDTFKGPLYVLADGHNGPSPPNSRRLSEPWLLGTSEEGWKHCVMLHNPFDLVKGCTQS